MSKIKKVFKKGSILAYTLIMLSVMLVIAASFASVSITEQKSASTTGKTTQAFQVAESGLEWAVKKVKDGVATDPDEMIDSVFGCDVGGVVSGNIGDSDRTYGIEFFDLSGAKITSCATTPLSNIAEIKSVGTFGNTVRSVQVAIAASGGLGEGQAWQSFTIGAAGREGNKIYQNQTGKPIMLLIMTTGGNGHSTSLLVDTNATPAKKITSDLNIAQVYTLTAIVPAGEYYQLKDPFTLLSWAELR